MRILHSRSMPDIETETEGTGGPGRVDWVYVDGECVGSITYVARNVKTGTLYGWRPRNAAPQSKLTTKREAIERLLAR